MSGPPIDRGWAFVVAFAVFISYFIIMGIIKSFGIIMREVILYFEIHTTTAALVMGISGAVYTVTGPFCMALGEHFTQRKVVFVGSIVAFVMVSLSSFLIRIEFFSFFFGVGTGLASAYVYGNGLVMIEIYFSRRFTRATACALTGVSVGTFIMPILVEAFLEKYSLSGAILIVAAIYLNGCICGALYRPLSFYAEKRSSDPEQVPIAMEKPEANENDVKQFEPVEIQTKEGVDVAGDIGNGDEVEKRLLSENEKGEDTANKVAKPKDIPKRPVWTFHMCGRKRTFPALFQFYVLKLPVVLFFTLFSFLVFVGYFNFILFLPLDAMSRGITKYENVALVSYTGAGDLLGRLLGVFVGDQPRIKRYKILATCSILCGVNIILFEIAGQVYFWMSIHAALYGFFGGVVLVLNTKVVEDFVGPQLFRTVLGMVLFFQGLGVAIGQPLEGKIRDETKSFTALNIINSICMIAAGVLLFMYPFVKRFQERSTKQAENMEFQVQKEA
ncbi:monocarboxylate transporter 12-like [Ostrea edulis]|uniref:monocarboxylate transporter 12-like n=1 Tax=Ostrea edulis TaxID=37623 RepID=UPI0024AEBBA9|nr:monocarboxylate transporter 12-like [Ostrea edulis]